MTEKPGDVFYHVDWYLGFNPGDKYWDDDCDDETDVERATSELETYRVRSMRRPPRRHALWWDPSIVLKQVTAFRLLNLLTVNARGEWVPKPDVLFRRQWRVGERPKNMARTKSAAYRAAIAAIRASGQYRPDSKEHRSLLGRLKGQMARAPR